MREVQSSEIFDDTDTVWTSQGLDSPQPRILLKPPRSGVESMIGGEICTNFIDRRRKVKIENRYIHR
ncbi:uncharacterized protein N7479_009598 [Penicillium vulpinum]|uniref:uncharacterized protein n=1 Tax=Penicillium vulpinum TaxID=29845 RepID=UPI002547238E|nr:uncharacterized protein N7479_009598 [Penicillium vulpinum]KAJ5951185.1 hypothetical protein N7479_009598 [Penicillium vulpinum]